MSEWRGLANPEWHDPNKRAKGWAWCEGDCNTTCHKDELCRCCLAAEVERLTEALADREAAIQRVRGLCEKRIEDMRPFMAPATLSAHEVMEALRGESDE